ncbi:hypothetical protein AURDEDRAFT_171938 [Auricularia subglabra TFB-10046 SS5]|nr:hypothetical protein AURDEDRAFT_171938 [Auricularia subglabra TFB-10046 SS5]
MLLCFRYASSIRFPADVLGGQLGALRHLELRGLFLPVKCPALANVTHVRTGMANDDLAEALKRLWVLCPRLERLTLRDLVNVPLPTSLPPPSTLAHLQLQTSVDDCDLSDIIATCSTPALKYISISLPLRASRSLVSILRNAAVLSVEPGNVRGDTGPFKSAFALLSDGQHLKLEFNDCDAGHGIGVMLDSVPSLDATFTHLRALTMPLLLFYMFIRGRPALPDLREVCIIVQQAPHRDAGFDWTRISCLSLLGHYRLATIALEIRLPDTQYTVRGIPHEVAREVEIPQHGPKIAFELSPHASPSTWALCDDVHEAFGWAVYPVRRFRWIDIGSAGRGSYDECAA